MTEKMKTVCVGRYLIDVPTQAELSLTRERIDGFEIESVEESELKFRQRIGEREAEINRSGTEPSSTGPGRIVETHELRISGMIGRVVTFGRTRSHEFVDGRRVNVEWVSVEAHAHIRGRSFTLSAKYVDESDASAAEALLTRLQLRAADEIPKVPGFCISHAMFAEPLPEHRSEQVAMHLSMPDHPGLALTLLSVAGGRPGPGLLARYKQIEANASADEILRVTKLRSEPRSINGLTGEELIERIREFNFTTTYTLNWESRGTQGDLLLPYLSLEAQVGMGERPGATPAGASLHEDALLILWDSVASSIRQRKGDLPPHSGQVHEPSGPKLGAVASAGDISPQSGWWRCSEGGPGFDVHGGQTQYVRRGDRMPQALLLPHQTLWQKLKRIQPSVENNQPTVWTLVDKRLRPRKMAAVNLAPAMMPATGLDLEVDEGRPVAVGTYVRTGDKCPASGWWRCEEPHALDGTRWFARGSLLPAATFQVPAGVFAKSTGPEVIQRRSAWELMRHAETPSVTQAAPPNHDGLPVDEPPALA